ncbi:MAG: hypothetical protein ACKV2T_09585 [Kofleriaceae bacterium]
MSFAGLNGDPTDWISIAPTGSPLETVTRWRYTGGGAAGSITLEGPTTGGSYVARAFDANSYTLMGESDPFTVANPGDTPVTLSVDQPDYAITDDILVTFAGFPGNQLDWVAISPVGGPDDTTGEVAWLYTAGVQAGSLNFRWGVAPSGRPGGYYEARAYLNDTYTRAGTSVQFLVGSLVTTDASSYSIFAPVTVNWTHLPGGPDDWVALAPAGSAPTVFTSWMYTGGAVDGSVVFSQGVASAGTYVARTFAPNSYVVSGESAPFTVTGTAPNITVTTDQGTYNLGQTITVSWTNLPGNNNDWISIAPAGSPDTSVIRWVYTGGQANGSYAFEGISTPGNYVARAFLNDLYVRLGESSVFNVNGIIP